ncbi:MAG TPA: BON domain-containing protein [Actinomycetota bacterium]|nr:BON domain-containing protein [Actinomycetota bacterium]
MAETRYDQERIRQALATDPRVGEPELSVEIVAGRVLISGSVPSREVRDAVATVVAEVAPGLPFENRVEVARRNEPAGEEPIT